jgi:hypothetical protein
VRASWAGDPRGTLPNPLLHEGDTSSGALARQHRFHGYDLLDDVDFNE